MADLMSSLAAGTLLHLLIRYVDMRKELPVTMTLELNSYDSKERSPISFAVAEALVNGTG